MRERNGDHEARGAVEVAVDALTKRARELFELQIPSAVLTGSVENKHRRSTYGSILELELSPPMSQRSDTLCA